MAGIFQQKLFSNANEDMMRKNGTEKEKEKRDEKQVKNNERMR